MVLPAACIDCLIVLISRRGLIVAMFLRVCLWVLGVNFGLLLGMLILLLLAMAAFWAFEILVVRGVLVAARLVVFLLVFVLAPHVGFCKCWRRKVY